MNTYRVKLTWVDRGGNAVCAGIDETVTVEADSPANAAHQAQCDALNMHDDLAREKLISPAAEIMNWELSVEVSGGAWDMIDEYDTLEAAIASAKEQAANVWHDDEGRAVFGITGDPNGSAYEHRVTVHEDGTAILATDGAIVGTV